MTQEPYTIEFASLSDEDLVEFAEALVEHAHDRAREAEPGSPTAEAVAGLNRRLLDRIEAVPHVG
jgi:hypothetical protein